MIREFFKSSLLSRCSDSTRLKARRCSTVAVGLAALVLAGCIVIPTPAHRPDSSTRANVDRHTVQSVVRGEPLADVLLRLGEPDDVSIDGRQLAYRWERTWGYWMVSGGYGGGAGGRLTRSRALVIDLDEKNRVREVAVGVDNLFFPSESEDIFTPDHGGRNTTAKAASLRSAAGLSSFLGEPLEFQGPARLFPSMDAKEFSRKSIWSEEKFPESFGGVVLMSSKAIHFKTSDSHYTDAPEVTARFAEITGLEWCPFRLSGWVTVRLGAEPPNPASVFSLQVGGKSQTKKFHEQAERLWRASKETP